ncbi:hypothetical protein BO86DRAFT_101128 [Aspergillus japonicus CBS 114.51]|uniref:Uncharacterized protein n=1 Tax=Aspergillus japonicus CBS 114.51 TaxID=1448312 RepID=A0A8T8WZU0_ASPJA|nr:hypothetical protein BO86DRAFT_101128 [Aspergillus japonicus CBS 114.51]RAH81388.1 hypothetical protein BO86DRAFT_101128 [Aspergillus japonicus CBS 114.51]
MMKAMLTERGAFPISGASASGQDGSSSPATVLWSPFLAVRDNWIVTGARRRLWFPLEYRGFWVSHGRVLYIGSKFGRILKHFASYTFALETKVFLSFCVFISLFLG